MVGIAEIGGAYTAIRHAIDVVSNTLSLKTETEINKAIFEIQRALLDAQKAAFDDREQLFSLQQRLQELQGQVDDADSWKSERARYALTEFPTGVLAYVLKDECANGEPFHRLCAKCFDENKKSILQVAHKRSGGESVACPNCKEKYILHPFPEVRVNDGRSGRNSWMA